jgi:hypothetical protein
MNFMKRMILTVSVVMMLMQGLAAPAMAALPVEDGGVQDQSAAIGVVDPQISRGTLAKEMEDAEKAQEEIRAKRDMQNRAFDAFDRKVTNDMNILNGMVRTMACVRIGSC